MALFSFLECCECVHQVVKDSRWTFLFGHRCCCCRVERRCCRKLSSSFFSFSEKLLQWRCSTWDHPHPIRIRFLSIFFSGSFCRFSLCSLLAFDRFSLFLQFPAAAPFNTKRERKKKREIKRRE